MKTTTLGTLLGAAALAALWACPPAGAAETGDLDRLRGAALDLVNERRREHDLAPLRFDEALNAAAQAHSEDMLARGYYAHESPEGETVMDRYLSAGGSTARAVAENIARCDGCPPPPGRPDVAFLTEGWMDSPGHRRNILDPGMDRFGFGIVAGEDAGLYATQTFAGPGAPRGAGTDGGAPIGPEVQQALLVDHVNEARREAGVPELDASADLSKAARDAVPEDISAFDPAALEMPASWRTASIVAGSCGGCGTRPTEADIRFFVRQWLDQPDYARRLTDPAYTHAGMALAADGDGRKLGAAVLAGR
ncbi:CAP domain-containing protein [Arenibaculum sp.]|jgi:uncharacterized protein YkwD|uniref:CAP domain-containing protein n=1 Tax=Arenibaculum sp. TaxID=2865862 RepID=UPI002E0E3F4D|nr:CAP domain-containing protein [Arenibaculum sp.]